MGCDFSCWWRWRPNIIKDPLYLSSMETCVRVCTKSNPALALICHWYPLLHNSQWRLENLKVIQSDPPSNLRFPTVPTPGCDPALVKAFCGKLNLHAQPLRWSTNRAIAIPHTSLAPLHHCQRDQSLPRPALPRGYQKDRWYPRDHSTHSHRE